MLGYNRPSVIDRPASEYPPADFTYETLFLDSNTGTLSERQPSDEGIVEYRADSRSDDGCKFVYTFEEYTELFGISKLKVWMSTEDHDDMVSYEKAIEVHFLASEMAKPTPQDVYVVIRKLDKEGKALWHQNIPMQDLPQGTTVDDIPHENVW
jgi:predicted acyl esterase